MSDRPRPGDIVRIGAERTRWRVVAVSDVEAVVESVATGLTSRRLVSTLRVVEPHPGGAR